MTHHNYDHWGIMAKDLNKEDVTAHRFNEFGNSGCGAVHAGVPNENVVLVIPVEERKCRRCDNGNGQ